MEKVWKFLKKLKLPNDAAISLLGIFTNLRQIKTCPSNNMHMNVQNSITQKAETIQMVKAIQIDT